MRLIATALLLAAFTTGAIAQQLPTEYTLTVSPEELNALGRGLDELPAKIANPVSQRLLKQIADQNEVFRKKNAPPEPKAHDPNGNKVPPK